VQFRDLYNDYCEEGRFRYSPLVDKNAPKVIKRLQGNGFQIIFCTSRPQFTIEDTVSCLTWYGFQDFVLYHCGSYIDKQNQSTVFYSKWHYERIANISTKGAVCLRERPWMAIEDNPAYATAMATCGVKETILIAKCHNYKWRKSIPIYGFICRILLRLLSPTGLL
jgi:hypothetical protein